MWELGEHSDCGNMGAVRRKAVSSRAGGELFLENLTKRFEAVLDCFAECCGPNNRVFEMLEWMDVYEVEVHSLSAEDGSQIEGERMGGRTVRVKSKSKYW